MNPRALPQMADAELLFRDLPEAPDRQFIALVVNLRGVERAIESQARHVRVALSASEGHSRSNTNRTVAEGIDATRAAVDRLRAAGDIGVSAGLAVAFVCPFDGVVPLDNLVRVVRDLVGMGLDEIVLGDTLGRADPRQIERTLQALQGSFPATTFSLHLHDTYGMGMANVVAGLEQGVDQFDAALGGIGGCPYAPGAAGNIATEDLVFMLNSMEIDTGVDLNGLRLAAARLGRAIESPLEIGRGSGAEMDADGRLDRRRPMKVLLVGGSGLVGTFVTPYLAANHELRVLDVAPPRHSGLVDYVPGSIANPDDVARALEGMDTFVNMVMRNPQTGLSSDQDIPTIVNNYEVNTLGLHLLLWTAQGMGIKAGVHTEHDERPRSATLLVCIRRSCSARQPECLRPHQGTRRTDLPLLRGDLRDAHHRSSDHGAPDAHGLP